MNTGIHLRGDNYGVGYPVISLLAHGDTSSSTATNGGLIEFCFNSNSATAKIQETSSGTLTLTGSLAVTSNLTVSGTITGHASLDLPLTGGTLSGSVSISATGTGFNLTDTSGTTYGGIYDNGNNMWIGSASSTSPHHRGVNGYTYISSGYSTSNSAGNSTVYVWVPTLSGTTWGGNAYGVLHSGNYSGFALPLSGGTLTGSVTLNNNVFLYAKDPNGTSRILSGIGTGSTPPFFFGYGSRDGQIGASYFDGHVVYIRSNNSIYMQCTGASINAALTVTGTLTGYDYSGASHVMVGSAADTSHRVGYLYHQNPTTVRVYGQAGGSDYTTYTTLTGSSSSDIRLKRNVADTEIANALSVINQIKMRSFDWLPGWRDYTHQPIGMIADQIEKLDSRLVIGGGYDPDGQPNYKVIDDHYLACYLTKGVQELCDRIEMLEREIKALKGVA